MAVTGQCYCGRVHLSAPVAPLTVAYCHCTDCRRWTGAPLPAFAAFNADDLTVFPDTAEALHPSGVARRHCADCGSPLTARFPYLPGQVYVCLGLLDNLVDNPPALHCHAAAELPWLPLHDGVARVADSGTAILSGAQE